MPRRPERARAPAPFRCVAVATDLSPAGRSAIGRAALLPLASDARVHLVTVVEGRRASKRVQQSVRVELDAEAKRLGALLAKQGHPEIQVRTVLEQGNAAAEVARVARETRAELVVVGRRGRTRMRELLLGTTADRIAQLATMPVLIAGGSSRRAYERPLVALDGTRCSGPVVETAVRLVPGAGRVRVLTAYSVFGEGLLWSGGTSSAEIKRLRARAKQEASTGARRAIASVGGGVQFDLTLRHGDARTVVARLAEEYEPDLLALGTRETSNSIRLGRVATHVLRTQTCDLLVVPTATDD